MPKQRDRTMTFDELSIALTPAALNELRAGNGLPGRDRLRQLELEHLINSLRRHGGVRIVYHRLGFTSDPRLIHQVIAERCGNGVLPTDSQLKACGLGNLVLIIKRHFHGFKQLAHQLQTTSFSREKTQSMRRRRLALRRLLFWMAQRTQTRPSRQEFSPSVRRKLDDAGGVRRLLCEFLQNGCPPGDRAWLAELVREKLRARWGSWTRAQTALGLRAYVIRSILSTGLIAVDSMIMNDKRWGLRSAIRKHGGLASLLNDERFFPELWLRSLRLKYVRREIQRLAPSLTLAGRMPPRPFILKHAPPLEFVIRRHCSGYTATARQLGLRTQRGYVRFVSWQRTLRMLGDHIVAQRRIPAAIGRHTNDELLILKNGGPMEFLWKAAADRELRMEVRTIAERLRQQYRHNGKNPRVVRQLIATSNQLVTIANWYDNQ